MKTVISTYRAARSGERVTTGGADDNLGRGMDMALTLAVFIVLGVLLDNWLGTLPLMTIIMIAIAAVGVFVRMKYVYNAQMEQLEAERLAARGGRTAGPAPVEDAA